jgi:enterochelin esterase-like enzyme
VPVHNFEPLRGRVVSLTIESEHLRRNMLGDPATREVAVHLPEGYDHGDADYPLLVALAGYTGSGLKLLAWQSFGETLPHRVERLVAAGEMGPAVVVFPDCFTSLGGNQYVDSDAMGHWASYLIEDVIPRIESEFRVRRGREHRAVFGRSSGGYGALYHAMRHAEAWGAAASHSGDCDFDIIFRRDLPAALDALARHDGDVGAFLDSLTQAKKVRGAQFHALMILAMAASFAPESDAPRGVRLPVDPHTCALDEERWSRWLAHDPLRMVDDPGCQANLRRLSGLFIDCGSRDEYFMHYGTRHLVRKLESAGIEHQYEEFEDGHSGVDYRLDRSLPFLYRALTGRRGGA